MNKTAQASPSASHGIPFKVLFPFPDKRTNAFFFLLGGVAILLSCIPYFYALNLSGMSDKYNWLIPPYPEDGLAYMAWVKQAANGYLLFKVKFTAMAQLRVIFQPVFLLAGWLSRLTGWHAGFTLFIIRIAGILFFYLTIGHFLNYLKMTNRQILISLCLLLFSSGVGWFGVVKKSADLWMPGINTFWSLSWSPLFPFAYGLIVLVLMWFCMALEGIRDEDRKMYMSLAGAMFGLLAFVHPYDIVFTSAALIIYALPKIADGKAWIAFSRFLLFAAPAVIIQIVLSKINPVLAAHGHAKMLSPSPVYYIAGLGLPGLLAVAGMVLSYTDKDLRQLRIFTFWVLSAFGLAYFPVWFQNKMMGGIHIPICILAGIAVDKFLRIIPMRGKLVQTAFLALLILFTLPTHIVNFNILKKDLAQDRKHYFLPASLQEALSYLDKNSKPDDVVLSYSYISAMFPGESGNTVMFGHWAQSVDAAEKAHWLDNFFLRKDDQESREDRIAELKKIGIKYIVIDPVMRSVWGEPNIEFLSSLAPTVFENAEIKILRVE